MKKVELALILKTIDAHSVKYTYTHQPESIRIEDVAKLKQDIIHQYENFMKEGEIESCQ